MARRSARKTKALERFDPVLPIRSSLVQNPKRSKPPKRNLLTVSNAIQTNSPILKEDIQSLLAATVRTWSSLTEDKKRSLIDNFPPAYRIYHTAESDKLQCPITEDFAANDSIIKRDVARFKRDVEAGFYAKKWQDDGRKAMRERAEGQFDEYIKQHAEDSFGKKQHVQERQEMRNGAQGNIVEGSGG